MIFLGYSPQDREREREKEREFYWNKISFPESVIVLQLITWEGTQALVFKPFFRVKGYKGHPEKRQLSNCIIRIQKNRFAVEAGNPQQKFLPFLSLVEIFNSGIYFTGDFINNN